MGEPAIKVIPTPFQEVVALLHSDALRAVEQAVASQFGSRIIDDYSTACTAHTQAELSVSGLTVSEVRTLLENHRDRLIAFGVHFLRDEATTRDDEEYPAGEDQHPSETVAVLGLGTGFGIKYAIYYNFLVNRPPAEFKAFLKNRRIPHASRFARELRRVLDEVRREADASGKE